ncbi:hypothetical protein DL546_002215 [Coniochaeta pulveracea]|uniref:Uncharacterized protein n=1 Tax=Coniochaeta pulveracea TaxID=177199 RepID=A0A420Y435_9PEZI|nr:hypothetical protein DL546_002215 [Coniochaeta pulveracea]
MPILRIVRSLDSNITFGLHVLVGPPCSPGCESDGFPVMVIVFGACLPCLVLVVDGQSSAAGWWLQSTRLRQDGSAMESKRVMSLLVIAEPDSFDSIYIQ